MFMMVDDDVDDDDASDTDDRHDGDDHRWLMLVTYSFWFRSFFFDESNFWDTFFPI